MIEREPDFEDDKIRAWAAGPWEPVSQHIEDDPTVIHLDVEHEEVFESRTYRFQPRPEVAMYLVNVASAVLPDEANTFDQLLPLAMGLIVDTTFKFLAKRDKHDGLISSLLVAAERGHRALLLRQDRVEEVEYRKAVQDFEDGYMPRGVLTAPLVTTLEEWRRYEQEEPFPRATPGPSGTASDALPS